MPAALYNSGSVCSSSGSAAAAAATASSVQQQQPQLGLQWWSPGWLAERARIQRLEMLDEVEEWQLLQVGVHVREGCIKACIDSICLY
jgi:ABC-type proline/glycine betaine transport system substrate-binding protein